MKKSKLYHLIEYLPLFLIISYFFIHNIIIVLIGTLLSLGFINNNLIAYFIKYIKSKSQIRNKLINTNDIDKKIVSQYQKDRQSKGESKLTLVETIEELGYIPSIDKCDKNNVA